MKKESIGLTAEQMSEDLIGIIYAIYTKSDPEPQTWFPPSLNYDIAINILTRSTCFLDHNPNDLDDEIVIIPFPEYDLLSITYFFNLYPDKPEQSKIASITILINKKLSFIFKILDEIKAHLRLIMKRLSSNHGQFLIILSQLYFTLKELLEKSKFSEMFDEDTSKLEDLGKIGVLLSFFHSKLGPSPFYLYPETIFEDALIAQISKDLELKIVNEIFMRTYANRFVINIYFEIPSNLARGQVEMCLLSFICEKMPPKKLIDNISFRLFTLFEDIINEPDIYLAFYRQSSDLHADREKVLEMGQKLKIWVRKIYQTILKKPVKE